MKLERACWRSDHKDLYDLDMIDVFKTFVKLFEQSNIKRVHKILCNNLDLQLFNQE